MRPTPRNSGRWKRITDLACVLSFSIVLALPLLGFVFDWHPVTPPVKPALRSNAPSPKLMPLRDLPERVEGYFDRHLGFRELMVRYNNAIIVLGLRTSPSTRVRDQQVAGRGRIVLGPKEWLYFLAEFSTESLRGVDPLDDEGVSRWVELFESRSKALGSNGVEYLLVVVPEKTNAVPQFLPSFLNRRLGPSRADQVVEALSARGRPELLDLREWFRAQDEPLYHRTGTHWNELGAFFAYRQVIAMLDERFPSLQPWSLDDFEVERRGGEDRGIAAMLGIQGLLGDEYVDLDPNAPRRAHLKQEGTQNPWMERWNRQGFWPGSWVQTGTDDVSLPRAVFLHDSFVGTYMQPFLSEHFEEATYYWMENISLDRLLSHHPDMVIEIRTERIFETHLPNRIGTLTRRASSASR